MLHSVTMWGGWDLSPHPCFKELPVLAHLSLGLSPPCSPSQHTHPYQLFLHTSLQKQLSNSLGGLSPAQTPSVTVTYDKHSHLQQYLSTLSFSSVSPPKPHPSILPAHRSFQLTSVSLLRLLSLHGILTPHPFFPLHLAKLYFLFRFRSDTTSSKSPPNTSPVLCTYHVRDVIYSLIQQTFIQQLLCARPCAG